MITKDATIREIHHRVKNNLQTVAALLRLQARRIAVPEARDGAGGVGAPGVLDRRRPRDAVPDAGRGDDFDEIADGCCRWSREVAATETRSRSAGWAASASRRGGRDAAGDGAASWCTTRSNTGTDAGAGAGSVIGVEAAGTGGCTSSVADDGRGLPARFVLADSDRLGLQIVRTLVEGELGGRSGPRPRGERAAPRPSLDVPRLLAATDPLTVRTRPTVPVWSDRRVAGPTVRTGPSRADRTDRADPTGRADPSDGTGPVA